MTPLTAVGSEPPAAPAVPLQVHERSRIRAAARHARRVYPGDVGELLHRELIAYAEFGLRISVDALIPRLATRILAMTAEDGAEVTAIAPRRATLPEKPAAAS
jgi:hypothetical protein